MLTVFLAKSTNSSQTDENSLKNIILKTLFNENEDVYFSIQPHIVSEEFSETQLSSISEPLIKYCDCFVFTCRKDSVMQCNFIDKRTFLEIEIARQFKKPIYYINDKLEILELNLSSNFKKLAKNLVIKGKYGRFCEKYSETVAI